jgi:hypothetical protein
LEFDSLSGCIRFFGASPVLGIILAMAHGDLDGCALNELFIGASYEELGGTGASRISMTPDATIILPDSAVALDLITAFPTLSSLFACHVGRLQFMRRY